MASEAAAGTTRDGRGQVSASLLMSSWLRRAKPDVLLGCALAIVPACLAYVGSSRVSTYLFTPDMRGNDIWFQADLSRTYSNMVSAASDHYRSKVHPLFSIISLAVVHALARVFRLEILTAVRVFGAAVAFLWGASFFALLRVIGLRRIDSALFTLVCTSSAAAFFWLPVPETYALGSLTIIWAMVLAAASERASFHERWFVAVNVATMSVTITNVMAAAATSIAYRRWRPAAIIAAKAAVLVTLVGFVQRLFLPSARILFASREEAHFLLSPESGGPLRCLASFLFHAMVAPRPLVSETQKSAGIGVLLTQWSTPGTGSAWGTWALAFWATLIALGVWALARHPARRFCLALGLTLGGQLLLHALYGGETFLYSIHFLPLLVTLAALATMTAARPVALVLAAALIAVAVPNNMAALRQAFAYVESSSPARYRALLEKSRRPADDWPRGEGHVVLAPPASRLEQKGYLEPGGSFSPAPGSFGISLLIANADGSPIASSNRIPLSQVKQKLVWRDPTRPAISTESPSYEALWQVQKEGRFSLELRGRPEIPGVPWLVVRSVGPAGGPVQALSWDGHRLLVNGRWSLTLDPPPVRIWLGDEREPGWMRAERQDTIWSGEDGWGAARLELASGATHVEVADERQQQESTALHASDVHGVPEMDLPDEIFAASMQAQLAHLLMGLVEGETRPGDPVHYVAPWTRDGAYVAVALARAGQLEVARMLARALAEQDYAGGFGAEADAPGLALWALGAVAAQANDPAFDAWVWPHVRRKAELILKMLDARQDVRAEQVGPIIPALASHHEDTTLVARAARDGLIVGRMDHHFPLFFVNAVSYLGLREAVAIAARADHADDGARYTGAAVALQAAWSRALDTPEAANERTLISMIWPTNIASARDPRVRKLLAGGAGSANGNYERPPLWTYFEVAKAHQWLALGEPERSWATVRWFWGHQASPGLYTWWEGRGEENNAYGWEPIRGWLNPPHVTPHYWTAAEMLLLQLDMLVAIERVDDAKTLVVGAGVPREWLSHPMSVGLLPTLAGGKVGWSWDGERLRVRFAGGSLPVRPGPSFPHGVAVDIE